MTESSAPPPSRRRCSWHALLCLGIVLGLCAPAPAAWAQTCLSGGQAFRPIDFQEFTINNTVAVGIDTSKLPEAATNIAMAYVSVEDATIRFRFSGMPTQTSGHELAPGANHILCGRFVIESFRAIRTSSGQGNAIMRVTLFDTYY